LHLLLEGRVTRPASGGPTALSADGLAALVDRVKLSGFDRARGQPDVIVDIRGADLYELGNIWGAVQGGQLNLPTTFSFSANATNDFAIGMVLPFVPTGVSPYEQVKYLLDAPNYDALKLEIKFGDVASCFGSYTTAPTLSAFGSTSGAPRVRVSGYFALGGAGRFIGSVPGRQFLTMDEVTGSLVETTAVQRRLLELPTGKFVRAITLKTGVRNTAVSSGNAAYASLSDTILSEIRVYRGLNNIVRYYPSYRLLKEEAAIMRSRRPATGYARIDFAGQGALGTSFDARALTAAATGRVDFYLAADVSGASNQGLVAIYETFIRPEDRRLR
jgi:hypothetical protein